MLPLNQVLSLAIPLIITIASLQLSKRRLQNKANKIIGQAQSTADTILKEAEEFSQKNKQNIEQLHDSSIDTQKATQARIDLRENSIQKRLVKLDKFQGKLTDNQATITSLNNDLQTQTDKILSELSKKSGINAFDAKKEVQDQLEVEFKNYLDKENAVYIKSQKSQATKKALLILKQTMQRFTGSSSVDKGSKFIKFNSKRAFELLCGKDDENLKYISEKNILNTDKNFFWIICDPIINRFDCSVPKNLKVKLLEDFNFFKINLKLVEKI